MVSTDKENKGLNWQHAIAYPTAESVSYLAKIGSTTVFFPTDDIYTRNWFYPRYRNGKLHEPAASHFLLDVLNEDSVFVDVGAHLGYFSMLAATKARKVFAIEALEFLISRIHTNACANHFNNVHSVLAIAGAETGFAAMPKIGGPGSSPGQNVTSLVPSIRLDDYFSADILPDVIKIDTEGFEHQVLLGAQKILENRPTLMVEFHKKMVKFGCTPANLYDFLVERGYRIMAADHRREEAKLSVVDREQIKEKDDFMVFCLPA